MLLRMVFSSNDENITDVSQVKLENVFNNENADAAKELIEEIKSKGMFSFSIDTELLHEFNNGKMSLVLKY